MYSPLQTLFWYDKPSDSDDEPELEFFNKVPTVWDETRVLTGESGKYIIIARRIGKEWFIGAITNNNSLEINLSFDFLPKDVRYYANVYSDDPSVNTNTKVKIERLRVDCSKVLETKISESGGLAIWLSPENQ